MLCWMAYLLSQLYYFQLAALWNVSMIASYLGVFHLNHYIVHQRNRPDDQTHHQRGALMIRDHNVATLALLYAIKIKEPAIAIGTNRSYPYMEMEALITPYCHNNTAKGIKYMP